MNPSSDSWSLVAIGKKDPENPEPRQNTYPSLYNFFDVLPNLRFETKNKPSCLSEYLTWVERGVYLNQGHSKDDKVCSKPKNPGPYSKFGQYFQSPRILTKEAADEMDKFHDRAVAGQTVFFSYRWIDIDNICRDLALADRKDWITHLKSELDARDFNSWLDLYQLHLKDSVGGLLAEMLKDAVQQSVLFVVLLTPNYGRSSWTLAEYEKAQEQLQSPKRKQQMRLIVLDCGGDPALLGLQAKDTIPVDPSPTPAEIAKAIREASDA